MSIWVPFFSFFFCVLQSYLCGSLFLVRFGARDRCCFNPTIEVVTCRLRAWCMLDVFLLPAFTRLGHECHHLLSPCMCAQTRPRFILSSEKVLGDGVRTHVISKGKTTSTGKILLRGGLNPRRCITQDNEPNPLPTELFRPRFPFNQGFYPRDVFWDNVRCH